MSGVVGHIHEAGVRRRWHPQDEFRHAQREGGLQRLAAPNVHNSLAIQKKHVGNMYRCVSLREKILRYLFRTYLNKL